MAFDQFDNNKSITGINVTPLVDITLVLLIIFMVTTTYIVDPSLKVDLPKSSAGDETKPSTLSVVLTRQNELYLNGQRTTEWTLGEYIASEVSKKPDLQAVISADTELPYGRVVRLITLVKNRGVRRYALNIEYTTAPQPTSAEPGSPPEPSAKPVEVEGEADQPAPSSDLDGTLAP
jgi:biopolymer transport protein ExbD